MLAGKQLWPLAIAYFFLQHFCQLSLAQDDSAQQGSSVFTKASNNSLLWGAYRPNLYFGVRPRIPKSIVTGLMWARVEDFQTVQNNFRHTCEQHEGMAGYGWDSYDPRLGGRQTIHDAGNRIDISTDFVKFLDNDSNGGSWGVRIKGTPREDASPDLKTTVVFYAGNEGFGTMEVEDSQDGDNAITGFEGDLRLVGQTQELGDFSILVTEGKGDHPQFSHPATQAAPLDKTRVHSMQLPEEALWQAKAVMFTSMKETVDALLEKYGQEKMPPPFQTYRVANKPGAGNLHVMQKTFEGAFEFDVLFSSGFAPAPLKSKDLTSKIKEVDDKIAEHFLETHKPQSPFTSSKYLEFSKSLFSNLIGGIGYFHGDQMIDRSYAPEYDEESEGFWRETAEARAKALQKLEGPYELFTSVPSRPFFPRGFLWDEGFHLLPILDWDIDLTLQIVKSYFNTMDQDGWIPREQILGPEARSKVPAEFQVQYPHYANPPTLFFVLNVLLDKISGGSSENQQLMSDSSLAYIQNPAKIREYLRELYPLLKRQYDWFRKTQYGDIKTYDREAFSSKEAYRWRGSTESHLLTSGLDDYPRPQPPHPGELHLDLISWMGMMTGTIKRIATALNLDDDAAQFEKTETAILRNIDDLHWNEGEKAYCDATVDAYEENQFVCHKGYISIFPFMTGLLSLDESKANPKLKAILDLISDPEELWSEHGIRSLSKRDEFYGTGENYWRSPVWINMNYLIVKELYNIATSRSPSSAQARKIYIPLRKNLVETVYKSWKATGFAWEQYNPETGAGQRTQHFTGWTSLVVKIMAMPDLEGKSGKGHDEL